MLTFSSLPAASRATTQTYRTHSRPVKPDPQEFPENKGAIRPTSETLSDSEWRCYTLFRKSNLSRGSRRDRFAEGIDPSTGPHLEGRFRLPGAVVPTLHASSCGS